MRVGLAEVRCDVVSSHDIGAELDQQLVGRQDVFDSMRFGLRQRVRRIYVGHGF